MNIVHHVENMTSSLLEAVRPASSPRWLRRATGRTFCWSKKTVIWKAHPEEFMAARMKDLKPPSAEFLDSTPLFLAFMGIMEAARAKGEQLPPIDRVMFSTMPKPGEVCVNMVRVLGVDGTDAASMSRGELEARQMVLPLIHFLQKYVPGFEDAVLVELDYQLRLRETRRIVGEYTLTADDVLGAWRFDDGICKGAYYIDIHDPDGSGCTAHLVPRAYDIPYRCLLPQRGVRPSEIDVAWLRRVLADQGAIV